VTGSTYLTDNYGAVTQNQCFKSCQQLKEVSAKHPVVVFEFIFIIN